jgi:hypothetical protein
MATAVTTRIAQILETDSGIGDTYQHYPKRVTPGEALEVGGAALKWYDLHAEDRPVPSAIADLARRKLQSTSLEARGLGFVILHRCGSDFYFLIVNTWRGSNELWETVLYKDGDGMADFAPFPRDGAHKPTFCVWELVPVWHETRAWVRFLESPRDQGSLNAWLHDRCNGPA